MNINVSNKIDRLQSQMKGVIIISCNSGIVQIQLCVKQSKFIYSLGVKPGGGPPKGEYPAIFIFPATPFFPPLPRSLARCAHTTAAVENFLQPCRKLPQCRSTSVESFLQFFFFFFFLKPFLFFKRSDPKICGNTV